METEALLELVASILEVEVRTVSLSDKLAEVDWDSLSNLSFIAEVDERLGVSIDADELANAETVADLQNLVSTETA